ncbi:hypothetical protein L1987_18115 [Smallanthus sonchifolius]|uniref:Uncharacterized protein n=1 Tax=Smallanthus sonchifolius TaxID=185202 RepID=A0ACB9J0Z9_9ASTR|nr:hypothetical protein L1987_18115 [Smallanthus sonchifolius]
MDGHHTSPPLRVMWTLLVRLLVLVVLLLGWMCVVVLNMLPQLLVYRLHQISYVTLTGHNTQCPRKREVEYTGSDGGASPLKTPLPGGGTSISGSRCAGSSSPSSDSSSSSLSSSCDGTQM